MYTNKMSSEVMVVCVARGGTHCFALLQSQPRLSRRETAVSARTGGEGESDAHLVERFLVTAVV